MRQHILVSIVGRALERYLTQRRIPINVHDAGHPHLHIVTLKVRADGSRIDTQNIGRNQSEKARKEIEIQYGLVKAEDMKKQPDELKAVPFQKVQYGKIDSRRAIAKVLDGVLNNYKYTSLPELNAVLKKYNVEADRGSQHSRTYQHKGLLYRILDEKGNKIGIPIKASSFHYKPTLKHLEDKFLPNEAARQPFKSRVKNAIDLSLLKNPNHTVESLIKSLEKEGIHTALTQNNEGLIFGITYVDHKTKCVFNGSDLGKQYNAKGIQERCIQPVSNDMKSVQTIEKLQPSAQSFSQQTTGQLREKLSTVPNKVTGQNNGELASPAKAEPGLLQILLQPQKNADYVPGELTKKGKKKKKKYISKRL